MAKFSRNRNNAKRNSKRRNRSRRGGMCAGGYCTNEVDYMIPKVAENGAAGWGELSSSRKKNFLATAKAAIEKDLHGDGTCCVKQGVHHTELRNKYEGHFTNDDFNTKVYKPHGLKKSAWNDFFTAGMNVAYNEVTGASRGGARNRKQRNTRRNRRGGKRTNKNRKNRNNRNKKTRRQRRR